MNLRGQAQQSDEISANTGTGFWRTIHQYLVISRTLVALPNAVPFVIGGMLAGAHPTSVLLLVAWALVFYSYSCKVNDLADFKTDLLNTSGRPLSPLLRGGLSPIRVGYWAAIELLTLAFTLGLSPISASSKIAGLGLLVLTTYGNAFQKTSRRVPPLVMDYLFGIVMATPIPIVASGLGSPVSLVAWLLSASFIFQMVVLNSYSGNLKDLEHDYSVGARTTAIQLGARRIGPSQWSYPTRYRGFLLVAQLCSSGLLCTAIVVGHTESNVATAMGIAAAGCALAAISALRKRLSTDQSGQLRQEFRPDQSRELTKYMSRPPHLILNAVAFLLAAGYMLNAPLLPILSALSLAVPALALRAIRKLRRRAT